MRVRANRALQESIICLAGCYAFCTTLIETAENQPSLKAALKDLKTARTKLFKVMTAVERDIDPDQIAHLQRQTRDVRLGVVSRANPQAERREVVVLEDDLFWMADHALAGCWMCNKTGKDAKRCEMRKRLSRMGVNIVATIPGECPYQDRGVE